MNLKEELELGGSIGGTEPDNGSSGHPIPEQDGCGPTGGVDGLAIPVGVGHEVAFCGGHGHRVRSRSRSLPRAAPLGISWNSSARPLFVLPLLSCSP